MENGTQTTTSETGASRHLLVELARMAVETYVRERRHLTPPPLTAGEIVERAGVFVCLKEGGRLRGCIGTFEPSEESIAEETITNAISAATRDPRFFPVSAEELANLEYTVDVLTTPERIASEADLDPKRHGVIVRRGARRGLLLPDLEGIEDAAEQVRIARQKAGIGAHEAVELYRFEVRRFS